MTAATGAPPVAVPVLKSLFSADALAALLEEAYGLSDVRCELQMSVLMDTYTVRSSAGSFLLRVYPAPRRTEEQVRGEIEFLRRLDQAGVAVTAPVARPDGSLWLAIDAPEGTRHAALFTFAPGQALTEKMTPANLRTYGGLLARVHDVADAMPPIASRQALTVEDLVDEPMEILLRALGPRSSAGYVGRYAAELVRPVIAALPMEPPVYGFCHGEPGSSNAMVTGDGRITLTDFDFCGPAWRAHDLAVAMNDMPEDEARTFLAAYQAARPLSSDEVAAIPHLQAAHYLWVLGMRTRYINEWGTFIFPEGRVMHVFGKIEGLVTKLKKGRTAAMI